MAWHVERRRVVSAARTIEQNISSNFQYCWLMNFTLGMNITLLWCNRYFTISIDRTERPLVVLIWWFHWIDGWWEWQWLLWNAGYLMALALAWCAQIKYLDGLWIYQCRLKFKRLKPSGLMPTINVGTRSEIFNDWFFDKNHTPNCPRTNNLSSMVHLSKPSFLNSTT